MNIKKINKKGVIIYGAGNAGRQVCDLILNNNKSAIIYFIDDDKKKIGKKYKKKIIYSKEILKSLKNQELISNIIIAIPSIDNAKLSKLFKYLYSYSPSVLNLPLKSEFNSSKINLSDLQKSELVDIFKGNYLKSKKVIIKHLNDKNILVTGAGGSIGSELVYQLSRITKNRIICLDKSEIALYNLQKNLSEYNKKIKFILGDIRDKFLIKNLVMKEQLDYVFHTAAYKHLNFLELNPDQAIKNNIIGTYELLNNLNDHTKKTLKVINISTDKAVRPTSVLGFSKRITEIICSNFKNLKNSKLHISTVRFGNVFGSNGSVINLFLDKINKGEKINLTHKKVERFFMSINEACNLVISASLFKDNFNTYILDMGKPVKIYDLLKKMIQLKRKYQKNLKIEIQVTGLNKGEKISEELTINKKLKKTKIKRIFIDKEVNYKKKDIDLLVKKIFNKIDTKKSNEILNDIQFFLKKEINL